MRQLILILVALMAATAAHAQVGEYRNELAAGGSAGLTMTTVNFMPKVIAGWISVAQSNWYDTMLNSTNMSPLLAK